MDFSSPLLDVLIIGGGPAGLSVATGLARQLYTAAVFDSGIYRNARAAHMHNVPGWDHRHPGEIRKAAKNDLVRRYNTIQFHDAEIKSVKKTDQGLFQATDAQGGQWTGRKLVLATGVRDLYPDIDGYSDCWATGIFHCLFCHGYEERGCASVGVLAIDDIGALGPALHLARMARQLAAKVTIYTNGSAELSEQLKSALAGKDNMEVVTRPITRLVKQQEKSQVAVHFDDGSDSKIEGFLVHKPKTEINGPFAQQLSLELTDQGDIKTSLPFYESSVPGVFAAGDCTTSLKAVTQAMATGTFGAGGIVAQLGAEYN